AKHFRDWRSGAAGTLPFELKLGRFLLRGNLPAVYLSGAARVVLGEMKGKHHCQHGLDALLLSAINSDIKIVEFAELKKDRPQQRTRPSHSHEQAKTHLHDLLELFASGQTQALPFNPDAGFAYVKRQASGFNEKVWEAAEKALPEQDIWWSTALRGGDPFIDHADRPETFPASVAFRDISLKVFSACAPEFIGSEDIGDD
ncbi:MAG: hypothetical protein ABIP02_01015, partial [Arenimonas sp.]